jgi:diguanylate cyclase (GGDEF)-like protein
VVSEPSDDSGIFAAVAAHGSAEQRDTKAAARDRAADERDGVSAARDEQATVRDERADARDRVTDLADAHAVSDREGAKLDRQESAEDREHAVEDRQTSSIERVLSARERQLFLVDGLTGARRRDAGMLELEREIMRANRTGQTFVLVFVDVDGLKAVNDEHGHTAGDGLLAQVAATMRSHLRPYDLIVRYGGDEFLCGLMDLNLDDTVERFALVNAILTADHGASVTAGVAQLHSGDVLQDLIVRADASLYRQREQPATPSG